MGQDLDEPVFIRENGRLGPFQTQILEYRVKPLIGESAHVMVMPLRAGETQPGGAWPLPPGLHILHAYTRLKMKKGVQVTRVVSMSPVLPVELSPEWEAILGMEDKWEPLSVVERQTKLLEKLDLDGLSNWTPRNAMVARDLVLAFHDSELGCTSMVKHEICITDREPFKEWFRHIPLPLLKEVHASLHDMLDAGAIHPSQSPWCNAVVLVRKDGKLCFCVDFCRLNVHTKKDSYSLP